MIKKLKRLVHLVLDSLMLPAAWFAYVVSGRTAAWGGHAMIRLFCAIVPMMCRKRSCYFEN